MNAPEKFFLPDIQSLADERALAIQEVGVRGVRYPLRLSGPAGAQSTVAQFTMTVALPAETRGTHMSRFVEFLEHPRGDWSIAGLPGLLSEMLDRLDAGAGTLELSFPWFVTKRAPVSGVESLLDHDVVWRATRLPDSARTEIELEVRSPVTSLCPCSKKISDYGAHNQRSLLSLRARLRDAETAPLAVEELIRFAEESASCEVFGLLKRPDEKWVTERAYDNPKFVEDLVRDVALRLQAEPRVSGWSVTAENFESIHNHSAYAQLRGANA
jgi:GTP cyclohydrolase I